MKRALSVFEAVAAIFLLAIALLTAGNVLLRETLGLQVPDWFDLSKQLQAIAMFWGIALAAYRGSHIGVDVLWERCGARGRRRIDLAATALTLAFLLPLAWMVWAKLGGTGSQTTSDLRLPLVWFYAVSAAGVSAAALLAGARLAALWRGLSTDPEE